MAVVDTPRGERAGDEPAPGPAGRRRGAAAGAAALAVVVAVVVGVVVTRPQPGEDALEARILGEIDGFLGWLEEHEAEGMVGEVSWPSDDPEGRWAELGRRWFGRVEAAGVPAAYWAAGEVWNQDDIPYLAFAASGGRGAPVDTVRTPGEVLTEVDGPGLNSAGGSYNACSRQDRCDFFSNAKRGRLGVEWTFDSPETLRFYGEQGISWIRLPIRWERLQPRLGGPLDEEVASALGATLDAADAAGLDVVLDLHNFGAYYQDRDGVGVRLALGDELGAAALVDVWQRIVDRYGTHPAIAGWGIMNEPVDMGPDGLAAWEEISQQTVDAIRATGDDTELFVGGYELSNVHSWPHDAPWVDDPLQKVRYEAHHHWDAHHGAEYEATYDEEVRIAEADG